MLSPTLCAILSIIIMYLFVYVEHQRVNHQSIDQRDIDTSKSEITNIKISIVAGILVWSFSNILIQNKHGHVYF